MRGAGHWIGVIVPVRCSAANGTLVLLPALPRLVHPASRKPHQTMSTTPATFDLTAHGLTVADVHRNLSPSALYEHAIRFEKDASIAENGALVAYSGAKTGRSPKDKRVVEHPASKNDIWWGPVNIPCDAAHLPDQPPARARLSQHARAALLLRRLRRLGPEVPHQGPRHLLAAVSRALHAHDAHPPDEGGAGELRRAATSSSSTPARFPANQLTTGMSSTTSIDLSLEDSSWSSSAPNTPAR